jgi:hypothetical protein
VEKSGGRLGERKDERGKGGKEKESEERERRRRRKEKRQMAGLEIRGAAGNGERARTDEDKESQHGRSIP